MKNNAIWVAAIVVILLSNSVYAIENQEVIQLKLLDKSTLTITLQGYQEINWNSLNNPEVVEEIKKGYEYLFNSTVVNFEVGSNSSFMWRVTLNGEFSNSIQIKEMPYHYSLYLPTSADTIELDGKTVVSNYHFKKEYLIDTAANKIGSFGIVAQSSPATVAPLASSKLPIKNSLVQYGKNPQSRFLIPEYTLVTGLEAQQIADMYKPYFVKASNPVSSPSYPMEVRYRVIRGYDPYSGINGATLIEYMPYFNLQPQPNPHCNDYEPIFVWVRTIGEKPYKVSYDFYRDLSNTFHWNNVLIDFSKDNSWQNYYNTDPTWIIHSEVEQIITSPSSYSPKGKFDYTTYARSGLDYPADVRIDNMSNHADNFDNTHLKARIANTFHTYDLDIADNDGSSHQSYTPLPLDDATLTLWYKEDMSTSCSYDIVKFPYDISDPFHGLFWEIADIDGKLPTLSATITSVSLSGNNIVAQVTATYDNTNVVGSVGGANQPLVGLWEDRFTAEVGGQSLGQATSINEYAPGKYTLTFNKGNYATGKTIKITVLDSVGKNSYPATFGEPEGVNFTDINFSLSNIDLSYISACADSGDLKFVLKGTPTNPGQSEINTPEEAERFLEDFKVGLAVPDHKKYISLEYNGKGNPYLPRVDPLFKETKASRDMFEADRILKDLPNDAAAINAVYAPLINKWTELVGCSDNVECYPWWSGGGGRLTIIPGKTTIEENGCEVYAKDAELDVEIALDGVNFYNSALNVQDKLPILKNYYKYKFNTEYKPRKVAELNTDPKYEALRNTYKAFALAQWYKTLPRDQVPFGNLIDSENIDGLKTDVPFDGTYYGSTGSRVLPVRCWTTAAGGWGCMNVIGGVTFQDTPVNRQNLSSENQKLFASVLENGTTYSNGYYYIGGTLDLPGADLIPLSMWFSNLNPSDGDKITVYMSLKNKGDKPIGPFKVKFYKHLNGLDPAGKNYEFGTVDVPDLAPDEYKEVSAQFDTSSQIGKVTISGRVNDDGTATELTTRNNLWAEDIEVLTRIPKAEIISPLNAEDFPAGREVLLEGSGYDNQDGVLSGTSLKWYANGQEIGTGNSLLVNLSEGTHTIKLEVTDSEGKKDSVSIGIGILTPQHPNVRIKTPLQNQKFAEGEQIYFEGIADDKEDGTLIGSWNSDNDGNLGIGNSISIGNLSVNTHKITFSATDSSGLTSLSTRTIIVEEGTPTITISDLPYKGINGNNDFPSGTLVNLSAIASDPQDGTLSGESIKWESNIDGLLGSGAQISVKLSEGTHTVTATATDKHGLSAHGTISIKIYPEKLPIVSIIQPRDQQEFVHGDLTILNGRAIDDEEGQVAGDKLTWSSDKDGILGKGEVLTANLSFGNHTISLAAVDSEGHSSTSTVEVIVKSKPPVAVIETPDNWSSAPLEGTLLLKGHGEDLEDGTITNNLIWVSDRDGQLGTGSELQKTGLAVGLHKINLKVTDSHGLGAENSVNIVVVSPQAHLLKKFASGSGSATLDYPQLGDNTVNLELPKSSKILSATLDITGNAETEWTYQCNAYCDSRSVDGNYCEAPSPTIQYGNWQCSYNAKLDYAGTGGPSDPASISASSKAASSTASVSTNCINDGNVPGGSATGNAVSCSPGAQIWPEWISSPTAHFYSSGSCSTEIRSSGVGGNKYGFMNSTYAYTKTSVSEPTENLCGTGETRTLANKLLRNVSSLNIDIGNDGSSEWALSGTITPQNKVTVTLDNAALQNAINSCGTPDCTIPIGFELGHGGTLFLSNLVLQYETTDTVPPQIAILNAPQDADPSQPLEIKLNASDNVEIKNVVGIINSQKYEFTNLNAVDPYPVKQESVVYSGDQLPENSVPAWTKANVFNAVANGILTVGGGGDSGSYYYDWGVLPGSNITIEANAGINDWQGSNSADIRFSDGSKSAILRMSQQGIYLLPQNAYYAMDAASGMHTYKIVFTQNPDLIKVYIDGVERLSGTATTSGAGRSWIRFGAIDNFQTNAVSYWDYIKYDASIPYSIVDQKFMSAVFAANVTSPSVAGDYPIILNATDSSGGTKLELLPFAVYSDTPEIAVQNVSSVSNELGDGEVTIVKAELKNYGKASATFNADLLVDSAVNQTKEITLPAKGSQVVEFALGTEGGNHTYKIEADSANAISELNESNNELSLQAFVHDRTPPEIGEVEVTNSAGNGITGMHTMGSNDELTISANLSDNSEIQKAVAVIYENGSETPVQEIELVDNGTGTFEGGTSISIPSGEYTLALKAYDDEGLASSQQIDLEVEGDEPDLAILPEGISYMQSGNLIVFNVTVRNKGATELSSTVDALLDSVLIESKPITLSGKSETTLQFETTAAAGNHTFRAVIDNASLIAEAREDNNFVEKEIVVSDYTPPVIDSISIIPDAAVVGEAIQLSVSASDNGILESVKATVGGNEIQLLDSGNSYSGSITVNNEGIHLLTVTAEDDAGLIASRTVELLVYGDSPDFAVTKLALPETIFAGQEFSIAPTVRNYGQAEKSARLEIYVDGNSKEDTQVTVSGSSETSTEFLLTLEQGVHNLTVEIDSNDKFEELNENDNSQSAIIFAAGKAPETPLVEVSPSGWAKEKQVEVSWNSVESENGIDYYEYRIDSGNWIREDSRKFTTSELDNGIHFIEVRAVDKAGLASEVGNASAHIDFSAPSAPIVSELHSGKDWNSHDTPYLSWNVPSDSGSGILKYVVSIDGVETEINGNETSYHTVPLSHGAHKLKLKAIDYVGLESGWSNEITVLIDKNAPAKVAITSSTHSDQSKYYTNSNPTFSWQTPADDNEVSGYYYIIDTDVGTAVNDSYLFTDKNAISTNNLFAMSSANSTEEIGLPNGTWYLHLSATDEFGSVGETSTFRFNIGEQPASSGGDSGSGGSGGSGGGGGGGSSGSDIKKPSKSEKKTFLPSINLPVIGNDGENSAENPTEIVIPDSKKGEPKGITGLIIYHLKKIGWPAALAMFAIIAVIVFAVRKPLTASYKPRAK